MPIGHRARAPDSAERPSVTPRRPSCPAVRGIPSKTQAQSSSVIFKNSTRTEKRPLTSTQSPTSKPRSVPHKQPEASASRTGPNTTGSGMPRGLGLGMGVRTEISANPLPQRNRLRRKASSQDQRGRYAASESSESSRDMLVQANHNETLSSPGRYTDPYPGSVFGITLPTSSDPQSNQTAQKAACTEQATSSSRMAVYASRQPQKISTQDLPPPTPNFAAGSSSTSTRCSESPGPFSRTSTPTSVSSHSPGIFQPPKFIPRVRQSTSPTRSRPPVTRRKVGATGQPEEDGGYQGLPALRESITSSSSSSTIKGPEMHERADSKKTRLELPPPTPPLRVSSRRTTARRTPAGSITDSEETKSELSRSSSRPSRIPHTTSKLPAAATTTPIIPPQRPSREGTPILETWAPSPIIQSNLSHLATTGHKRRESVEKALLSSPTKREEQKNTKSPAAQNPLIDSSPAKKQLQLPPVSEQAKASSPHLHSGSREAAPARTEVRNKLTKRDPSQSDASPAKPSSRFGFFSKRKPSGTDLNDQAPERLAKKGPTAGTGHEGYGKYARRGRSSSTSTAASRARSTSTKNTPFGVARPSSSRKSSLGGSDGPPELDDFFKDRLEPVVIGGGGTIRENRNSAAGLYKTVSAQSSVASVDSTTGSPASMPLRTDHVPARSGSVTQVEPQDFLPPSQVWSLAANSPPPETQTLAHRRSLHRSQLAGEAENLRIPPPIITARSSPSPAMETYDSTLSSVPLTDSSLALTDDLSEGHEGNWLKPRSKSQPKNKLSKKWKVFHRTRHSPERPSLNRADSFDDSDDVPVAIAQYQEPRTIAHYAMLDGSEQEMEDDLEDVLRNIEDNLEMEYEDELAVHETTQHREPSMLLPSPPKFPARFEYPPRPVSPKVTLSQQMEFQPQPPVRRAPRLQQVGRIPRVVSKRDRIHHPSPQSFSRPFAPRPSPREGVSASSSTTEKPTLDVQTDHLPSTPWTSYPGKLGSPPPTNGMLFNLDGEQEFLAFSPRKGSEVSGSSSSGILSLAPVTAVTPNPEAVLSEDEVWNEYDELLDNVASPTSFSPNSPKTLEYLNHFPSLSNMKHPALLPSKRESELLNPDSPDASGPTSPLHVDASLHPWESPTSQNQLGSPVSLSELYANYGNRDSAAKSMIRYSNASTISGSRYSTNTILSRSGSRSSTNKAHMKRVTQVMAEKTFNASTESLRFYALMTSRWLSFDRVLFSPVQEEIRNNRQDRVLVVDGLGNDDWSSYCALTYPDATIYNLTSTSARTDVLSDTTDASTWTTPSNHRHISHASIAAPFPFPKGFFTAVVFRFPAANTSSAMHDAIYECKRVLRPGGYLELGILDMDPVNMGNRARRAVRGAKLRLQAAIPDVNLSPTSDVVMKLLGRRGFENINRCIVGVPVAGVLSESRAGSMDEQRETPRSSTDGEAGAAAHTISALLSGETSAGDPHYPVAKMVARVGRWWWTKCYETGVLVDGEESIWNDKMLLGECEKRDTGLRLVVCYAQKPVSVRRRTASV